jgi:ABC-2 type transport system ATP-binding protein
MADEIAIRVSKVSKNFILPHERNFTLKSTALRLFRTGKTVEQETQHALRDISFEVKRGEFFGIVGRNGSGKSTLLKILAGIYRPTKGSVGVVGKLVPFIELGVGFNGELTGRENVYLNGALLGFARKQMAEMYHDIVEFAELEEFMDQKLKNYSSGMQVRLAFSLATRAQADVLLVDEVLAVGDADFQRKCFDYFKKLKKAGKTVVFVTHDMSAVREYCDRAILINDSRLADRGTADEIAMAYTRLFTPQIPGISEPQSDNRWGDGMLKYASVKASIDKAKDRIVIDTVIEAMQDVDRPIIGFSIKSAAGARILGTNTKLAKKPVGSLKKGQKLRLVWGFDNILGDGTFLVSAAAVADDSVTVHDWWEEADLLTVYRPEHTPYDIEPEISVHQSRA